MRHGFTRFATRQQSGELRMLIRRQRRFTKCQNKGPRFAGNMFQQDFSVTPRAFAFAKLADRNA
ncbi:hypothetical protein D3C72_2242370 [compost metagenome]